MQAGQSLNTGPAMGTLFQGVLQIRQFLKRFKDELNIRYCFYIHTKENGVLYK